MNTDILAVAEELPTGTGLADSSSQTPSLAHRALPVLPHMAWDPCHGSSALVLRTECCHYGDKGPCIAGQAVVTEDGALRPAGTSYPPSSRDLTLTLTACAPPEASDTLLCSPRVILEALNMIKLPDVFLFYLFSTWGLFFRGEAAPWGQPAQSMDNMSQDNSRATTPPHPHPALTSSQMHPLPAPMGAILPPEDAWHHPNCPYKATPALCCCSRVFAPERQAPASSFTRHTAQKVIATYCSNGSNFSSK